MELSNTKFGGRVFISNEVLEDYSNIWVNPTYRYVVTTGEWFKRDKRYKTGYRQLPEISSTASELQRYFLHPEEVSLADAEGKGSS